jgi:hypothetical protein
LRFNRDPVDQMIGYLEHFFRPDAVEQGFSLAISGGMGGARLTHSHERQFRYVMQSLSLWRDIANDMFRLWCLAEDDLLKEGSFYRLTNTGQGLNRVQQVSRSSSNMDPFTRVGKKADVATFPCDFARSRGLLRFMFDEDRYTI